MLVSIKNHYGDFLGPLCVVIIAAVFRIGQIQNGDVSWLINCAELLINGARLSVDFIETNPPASVFLYVPAVLFGRLLHIQSEMASDIIVFIISIVSVSFFMSILLQQKQKKYIINLIVLSTLASLLIIPFMMFGQREHFIAILLLPWLVVASIDNKVTRLWQKIFSGITCGLAICIKPHYALIVMLVLLIDSFREKSILVAFYIKNLFIYFVAIFYFVFIYFYFHEYFILTMPDMADLYISVHSGNIKLIFTLYFFIYFFIFLIHSIFYLPKLRKDRLEFIFLFASIISLIVYFQLGRGWPNHTYPALFFIIISLIMMVIKTIKHPFLIFLFLIFLLMASNLGINHLDGYRNILILAKEIEKIEPHPRILAIGSHLRISFPVTRIVGGTFVQRPGHLWKSSFALEIAQNQDLSKDRRDRLKRYESEDRQMLWEDFSKGDPSIILVEVENGTTMLDWARQDSRIDALLIKYRYISTFGEVMLYQKIQPD